jgi:hypothetical protein
MGQDGMVALKVQFSPAVTQDTRSLRNVLAYHLSNFKF